MNEAVIEVCARVCAPVYISYLRIIMRVRLFHQIYIKLYLYHFPPSRSVSIPGSGVCDGSCVCPLAIDQCCRRLMERLQAALGL